VKTDLIPGTHPITMIMPDSAGGEAKPGVWIKIVEEINDASVDHCHDRGKNF